MQPEPHPPPLQSSRLWWLRRMLLNIALIIVGFTVIWSGILFFLQDSMIYMPRPYPANYRQGLPERVEEIGYTTSFGRQTAFYMVPEDGRPGLPDNLWVCFHGNAAQALDWVGYLEPMASPGDGFLLVDYPGFGLNEGRPSPATIAEGADAALEALAIGFFHVSPESLEESLNVFGFSLGAAAGFEFATRHPVRRMIVMSPFTSASDMAKRMVGRPFHLLLRHRFDNRARLAELAQRGDPPEVHIFHSRHDDVIPFDMGQALADEFPAFVTLHELEITDHNWTLDTARAEIGRVLRGEHSEEAGEDE